MHHLLDVWDVRDEANVAAYQQLARAAFAGRRATGARSPCWSAGPGSTCGRPSTSWTSRAPTPAYGPGWRPSSPPTGRRRCTAGWPRSTRPRPRAILPSNGRRLVRALEVVELTGRPVHRDPARAGLRGARRAARARPCRARSLDERIEARVDRMWQRGLVDEVRGLAARGLREGRTASRALGYAQVLRHLDGELTEAQARDETVRATRRFARRQESWFRRDPRVRLAARRRPGPVGPGRRPRVRTGARRTPARSRPGRGTRRPSRSGRP